MAQHLKYLLSNLLLFFTFFSSAQSTTFFVADSTIAGLDNVSINTKLLKQERVQSSLYVVKNTIFFSTQDIVIVPIEGSSEPYTTTENKKNKVLEEFVVKTKSELTQPQNKTQVAQTPFPNSLPVEQKQTTVIAVSITTVTPLTFSKTISKVLAIDNCFSFTIGKVLSQKQSITCYNQNRKSFQVKIKYCNRPPPVLRC